MKRLPSIFLIICILSVISTILWFMVFQPEQYIRVIPQDITPSPIPEAPEAKTIENYSYTYVHVDPGKTIELFTNLPTKQSSSELQLTHECETLLINAAFYTKEDTNLGLFVTNDIVRTVQSNSGLLNGFFWQTTTKQAGVGNVLSDQPLAFAIQSGPLLITDSSTMNLSIRNDENARRMVAGIDSMGRVVFLSVFGKESIYTGPLLTHLPRLIQLISEYESLDIVSAINLDGGNHSAFLSQQQTLSELSPIGSFFCIR